MKHYLLLLLSVFSALSYSQDMYFPERGAQWEQVNPKQVNLDPEVIEQVIAFAKAKRCKNCCPTRQSFA
mgnify:CR=1 FL=1